MHRYQIEGDIAILQTNKGQSFTIDTSDLEKVLRYTWCIGKTGYLVANDGKKVIKLHRYLLDAKQGKVVDHINGNPLDNRRTNLRICSTRENSRNCKLSSNNTTGFSGVSLTPNGKYRARIMVDNQEIRLGHYDDVEQAAVARLSAENKYFGDFAPCKGADKDNPLISLLENGSIGGMSYCGKRTISIALGEECYVPLLGEKRLTKETLKRATQALKESLKDIIEDKLAKEEIKPLASSLPVSIEIVACKPFLKGVIRWVTKASNEGKLVPCLGVNSQDVINIVLSCIEGKLVKGKEQIFSLNICSKYAECNRLEIIITGYYQSYGELKTLCAVARPNAKGKSGRPCKKKEGE